MFNCCCLFLLFVIIVAGLTSVINNRLRMTTSSSNPPPTPPPNNNCVCEENMMRVLKVLFEDSNTSIDVNISINGLINSLVAISRSPGEYDGSYVNVNPPINGEDRILVSDINGFTIINRPGQTSSFTSEEMNQIFPTTLIPFDQGQAYTCSPEEIDNIALAREEIMAIPTSPLNPPVYLFYFENQANPQVNNFLFFRKQFPSTTDLSYEGVIFLGNITNFLLPNTVVNSCYFRAIQGTGS